MTLNTDALPKPYFALMREVTGKTAPEAAIPVLFKKYFLYKKEALRFKISAYEKKYRMNLSEFDQACRDGRIKDPYSYEVESDGWDWDSAVTELEDTEELEKWMG